MKTKPRASERHPSWDRAAYPAAEAGRLVGLNPSRVRRWLRGYEYTYEEEVHEQAPVLKRRGTRGSTFASFLDLIDLLFVKSFLEYGLSLQKVRKALTEAFQILGSDHFARRSFFTDGHNIYLEVKEDGEDILQLLTGGQWVIAPIIQEIAKQIDFHNPSGLARRWYPMGPNGLVVLDPMVSFGRPTIVGRGVATANIFDMYLGEDEQVDPVADWMHLDEDEVRAAIEFEVRLVS